MSIPPPAAATDSFRRHHHQMRDMMGRIRDILDVAHVSLDPGAVATILRELFGKFSIHLALEDRLLYPKLRSWPVPHLQAIADRFEVEMGGMKAEFDRYRRTWPGPQAISRDPARFVAETSTVLAALEQRINREDADLYPSFEATACAPAGRITLFGEEPDPRAVPSDEQLTEALGRALRQGGVTPFFQPKFDIFRKRIIGFEALARWSDPHWGAIPPIRFIAIAERTGLVSALGEAMLAASCREAARWSAEGHAASIAVNVSPHQLNQGNGFAAMVSSVLDETGLPPASLELEMTEGVMMEPALRGVIDALTGMGIGIAIDDFGTGYSSLAYLKRFSASTVKIDKSFIDDMPAALDSCILVDAIIRLGHGLGMTVVAEGVETAEQVEALELAGCDLVQGYTIAPALAGPQAFESLVAQDRRLADAV
ncbi:EAL domain-containing protein [Magnetospirillum sp. SS-4]|uniref:EAL domain-containing protein n=1 Tax=Magnetospirillum sp. SS-4 TaxID=2681465 RepID=UPI00138118BE|nr:EAL domain-containing protein [Magnetospirillum sp. SS-4]CAA7624968.1 putative signal transduction protein [Magnetospirillum sp. SS-4]